MTKLLAANKPVRPFLKWAGNKYRILEHIQQHLPAGKRLVEPGTFEIAIGGALPGTESATTAVVSQNLEIEGEPFFVE